ncbi:iron ABC transporter substrate-binding protein [Aceticella autotrophica]|uniref:Iron ABC transporter substrate-binding protein n=1 Tax=Aceticella autotrophica TaxID=2755338 RepID=A0A975AXC2_9THEO|nr:iron ABC transporter substrate-binding protein [Aceticella autotrophica]QSZ28184.1 iron ABC transporter substrate-binding protein [Aceticella autotrophica]
MKNISSQFKFFVVALLTIVIITTACSSKAPVQQKQETTTAQQETKPQKINVTDLAGRQVELTIPVNRVVGLTSALRFITCIDGAKKVVGIEDINLKATDGLTYNTAYRDELSKLPVVGVGGSKAAANPEKLVEVKPDVIFTGFSDKSQADNLQTKTGIPVVVLSYGTSIFDEDFYKSLKLVGKIMGDETRAQKVVDYIKNCQKDLNDRTKGIPNDKKPTVYVGAVSHAGSHGIESTRGNYPPFVIVNAKNVADETGKNGSIDIDKEKLLSWNPDIIFIDEGGLPLVKQDYQKDPKFYQSLKAVKDGHVYGLLPYVYNGTNIDTAIADCYYVGKVLYPEQFKDIDPAKKADEIYKFFYGKPLYETLAKSSGGFKQITLGQ